MKAVYVTERPEIGKVNDKVYIDTSTVPDIDPSTLKADQVLIQVKAFSLNIDDLHLAEGAFLGGMPGLQTKTPSKTEPLVLGSDFAGIVCGVGSKAGETFQVGQRVCGLNARMAGDAGTWAEYTVADAKNHHVVPIPDSISFIDAAALLMPLHVIHGLIDVADLSRDDQKRVLVIGASGGIGSTLIPILRHLYPKLYIVGVCSGRNIDFVKGLGVSDTVDYTKGPIQDTNISGLEKNSFDIVFDIVGGEASYTSGVALLKPKNKKGKFITSVGPRAWIGDTMLSAGEKFSWVSQILKHLLFNVLPGSRRPYYHMVVPTELHSEFYQTIYASDVRCHVAHTFPLDKDHLVKATDMIQSHRTRGKIVLTM